MVLETLAAKVGLDAAKEALSALRRRSTKKQFGAYLSAAVTELLALHPDIDFAEAKLLAAEATGEPPSPELLRARQMLAKAKTHAKRTHKVKKKRVLQRRKSRRTTGKKGQHRTPSRGPRI